MESFITKSFIPAKIHIKEQRDTFKRFNVEWTPVFVVLDPDGVERYRWEGYQPPDEFIGQLELALARSAFQQERWADAERMFREVAAKHPDTDYAPEAVYYAGVSKYKGGDPSALPATAQQLKSRYGDTSWARKSSVWLH